MRAWVCRTFSTLHSILTEWIVLPLFFLLLWLHICNITANFWKKRHVCTCVKTLCYFSFRAESFKNSKVGGLFRNAISFVLLKSLREYFFVLLLQGRGQVCWQLPLEQTSPRTHLQLSILYSHVREAGVVAAVEKCAQPDHWTQGIGYSPIPSPSGVVNSGCLSVLMVDKYFLWRGITVFG